MGGVVMGTLAELLMGRAWLNHRAVASSIQSIGSSGNWMSENFTSGTTNVTSPQPLPSGCAAGDVAVITCCGSGDPKQAFDWDVPANGSAIVPSTAIGNFKYAVLMTVLQQADVNAGTVGLPFTVGGGTTASGDVTVHVYRGSAAIEVDVVGSASVGALSTSPMTVTAPGVSTLSDGEILQYALFTDNSSGNQSVTPPSGWAVDQGFSAFNGYAASGFMQQAKAGPTGDVSLSVTDSVAALNYAALVFALRMQHPAIALAANPAFPTNLHVGDTGSFDVTATLVDGATGPLTITASGLPDGMTLGATTDNGDGTFTATANYNLTTQQDVVATFSATGGSVAATPLTNEFVVQASSFQIVEQQSAPYAGAAGTGSFAFTKPVQAGDFVVIAVSGTTGAGNLTPSDSNGTPYTLVSGSNGTNGVCVSVWVSAAQAASNSFSVDVSAINGVYGEVTAYLLRGASSLTVDTANIVKGATSGGAVASGATRNLGAYSTSGAAFVVAVAATYQNGGATQPWTFGNSVLTTDVDMMIQTGGHSAMFGHNVTTGAVSSQTFQAVSSSTGTTGNVSWVLVPFLI